MIKKQKEWASFRITILLYVIVLLLGINFYFMNTAFEEMQGHSETFNILYITSLVSVLLTLYIIYFVRLYIQKQMKKHAIYDHETKLFNKQYFLAECKSSCAKAVRHEYPLSMLLITINGFEKETKVQTFKAFGTLISSLVRDGDLPCRYDENNFLILLPFTQKENALIFENRIREALMEDTCMISQKINFDFSRTEFDKEETEEAFIRRSV